MSSAATLLPLISVPSLQDGLARTPQMGYNSWYDLQCSSAMNETTLKRRAAFMVSSGLKDAGYEFVNLDDCFVSYRDADGTLQPDPKTFPGGMRALSDAVHNMDMKFGVYTDRGDKTCAGRPAALGHEAADAHTYAMDWKIDYLKEDSCHASADHAVAFAEYGKMRDALNATGRPIVFSLCGWNAWYAPVGASLGHSWRIGPDDTNWEGVLKNIDAMAPLAKWSGPGGWNDPCLLLSQAADGTLAVTEQQTRAQFSMWAILAAPLLISGRLDEGTSPHVLQTYLNRDVIRVSQDVLGRQGTRVSGGDLAGCTKLEEAQWAQEGESLDMTSSRCTNVWSRRLAGAPGSAALVFLNAAPSGGSQDIRCDKACWSAAGFGPSDFPLLVTDLWSGEALPPIASPDFTAVGVAEAGGLLMIQVVTQPKALPHARIPACASGTFATLERFQGDNINTTAPAARPLPRAAQPTQVRVCHEPSGLRVLGNATDTDVWSTAQHCNDPTYSDGDVLEVFVSPVASLADSPSWYLEIDTGASGALFAQLSHNPRNAHWPNIGGNASGGVDCAIADEMNICAKPCDAHTLGACLFKCTGASSFIDGLNVNVSTQPGWWAMDLFVPFALFPSPLVRKQTPWPLWRLNFHRYDYPRRGPSGTWDHTHEELSGWSSSGQANFHMPHFMGTAELV